MRLYFKFKVHTLLLIILEFIFIRPMQIVKISESNNTHQYINYEFAWTFSFSNWYRINYILLKISLKIKSLGAASGIGRATCQCLAKEGAIILAADKDVLKAQETVSLLTKNSKHLALQFSVENKEAVQNTLTSILKTYTKPPSIIVNAAGITKDNFISKLSEEDFNQVLDVNLKGTFLVLQTFANSIVENKVPKASIINIGSIVAKYGNIGQANYCASKAGVDLITKVAAKEYGKLGIRINAILPGFISTPMTETVPDKVKEKFLHFIPLARFGKPEEVAEVITFLASDKSSYVNGASIEVTGGF